MNGPPENEVNRRRRREVYRSYVDRVSGEIRDLIRDLTAPADLPQAIQQIDLRLAQIEQRWASEDIVNLQILSDIADEGDYVNEVDAQERHKDERIVLQREIVAFIDTRYAINNGPANEAAALLSRLPANRPLLAPVTNHVAPQAPAMLPEIKPFDVYVFKWQNWWEIYDATVHQNPSMSVIAKFTVLDKYVQGKAAEAFRGLGRIEANYQTAVNLLTARYSQPVATENKLIGELFELCPVSDARDVKGLRRMLDEIEVHVRSLSNIGTSTDSYCKALRPRLVAKLPRELQISWNERQDCETAPIDDFIKFLTLKVQSREKYELGAVSGSASTREPASSSRARNFQHSSAVALVNTAQSGLKPKRCPFCHEGHRPFDCPLSVEKRNEAAMRARLCLNCLGKSHRASECFPHIPNCKKCGERHHTSICKKSRSAVERPVTGSEPGVRTVRFNAVVCTTLVKASNEAVLQTATLVIETERGDVRRILCLFDLGSQRTIVRKQLAEELQLVTAGKELVSLNGLGSRGIVPEWKNRRILCIAGTFEGAERIQLEALEHDSINEATPAPSSSLAMSLMKSGAKLADDRVLSKKQPSVCEVDLLIGADVYWQIVSHKVRSNGKGLAAISSKVGWLLSGPIETVQSNQSAKIVSVLITSGPETENEASMNSNQLQAFWEIEHIGIRESDLEHRAVTVLERIRPQIVQLACGRYQVPLPWNHKKSLLRPNRSFAENCLKSLLRRLARDPELLAEYHRQIQDFVHRGWVEAVSGDAGAINNCLPHLPVIRMDKKTTKVRIVFNASAKRLSEVSLNDAVEVGENLYPDMLAMILRFGWKPVAWIGDVEKAFLQVELKPEDRPACRFLWIANVKDPLHSPVVAYQWNRVIFGVACSPFLLTAVVREQLEKSSVGYPDTAKQIREKTFVDDWLGGDDSVDEAYRAIQEAKVIFKGASMPIGKWVTNNPELRQLLAAGKSRQKGGDSGMMSSVLTGAEQSKVLGLRWDPSSDHFYFEAGFIIEEARAKRNNITKRELLKIAAQIFDPVGYIGPVIIKVKILFQELWKIGIGWDEVLPCQVLKQWAEFIEGLGSISSIKIPRHYFSNSSSAVVKGGIHVFRDASQQAYGAVAYVRAEFQNGFISTRIVACKTRVAPLKSLTMPRLELLAALVSARLGDYVRKSLLLEGWPVLLWTDFTVAQTWVNGDANR